MRLKEGRINMAQPKEKPPISNKPPIKPGPFTFLIEAGLKFGLGAGAVNIAKKAYEYMEDRGFEPFRPGTYDRDSDYYDEPVTKYDHRNTDSPMTAQTGQTIYDMRSGRDMDGMFLQDDTPPGS